MKIIWFLALVLTIPTSGLSLIIALIITFLIINSSKESRYKDPVDSNVSEYKKLSKSLPEENSVAYQQKNTSSFVDSSTTDKIPTEPYFLIAIKESLYRNNVNNFLSASSIAKIFGLEEQSLLFNIIEKNNYIINENGYYSLTKKGEDIGAFNILSNSSYIYWDVEKLLSATYEDILKETYKINCFDSIYHMTHINNLRGILSQGLFSHSKKIQYIDISNMDVNDRRRKKEPIYSNEIHDYVPFYFNVKNAMLYQVQRQFPIVILEFDIAACALPYTIFSDQNAATDNASFISEKSQLESFDWDLIRSQRWSNNGIRNVDIKQKMMAECLIKDYVPSHFIKKIHCERYDIYEQIKVSIDQKHRDKIVISPDLFF